MVKPMATGDRRENRAIRRAVAARGTNCPAIPTATARSTPPVTSGDAWNQWPGSTMVVR
jgi:hypothetical protein